jgi:hypothetical protein
VVRQYSDRRANLSDAELKELLAPRPAAPWQCSECGTSNEPGACWCRVCNDDDVNAVDPFDPLQMTKCKKGKAGGATDIAWRTSAADIGSPNQGWNQISFWPQGRMDCVYV